MQRQDTSIWKKKGSSSSGHEEKIRHYFESYPIIVVTNYPIRQILSKSDLSIRLTQWAIEMEVYEIKYTPKAAKNSQVIAYFLVEIQSFEPTEKELTVLLEEGMRWILNTDEVLNKEGVGIRVIIESSSGVGIEEVFG